MKKSTKSSLTEKAMRALAEAVAEVVEDHRRRARLLAVWRNGQAVWIPATEAGALHETPPLTARKLMARNPEPSAAEASEILSDLLEKYAMDGELQFTLPDVLKVAPIWRHASVGEIARKFGGVDELRNAVNGLQTLLYAA